jgi:rare lipoprotein A
MTKTLMAVMAAAVITAYASPAHAALASWYDCAKPGECSKSKITASGEKFNPWGMTAAHKTLPMGTRVLVTHKGRSVVVRINDRGPYIKGRTIDLSRGAAKRIGCHGVCNVSLKVMGKSGGRSHSKKSVRQATSTKPVPGVTNLLKWLGSK